MTQRNVSVRFFALLWTCLTALALTAPAHAIQIDRICSDKIYVDPGTGKTGIYLGYGITNDDFIDYDDLWVTLSNFTGGSVTPAPNEDGFYHIGSLAPGETKPAYLFVTIAIAPAASQGHTVDTRITPGGISLASETFFYDVEEATAAVGNQITPVVSLPDGPVVGGMIEITVTGQTAPSVDPVNFVLTPATAPDWPADVFELENVSTQVWSQGDGCTALVIEVNGSMIIAAPPDGAGYCYATVYEFRALAPTPAPTPIAPIQYINSGAQIKYEDLDCLTSCVIDEITPAAPLQMLTIDGARFEDTTPILTFRSDPAEGADPSDVHYQIQWDDDPTFATAVTASSDTDPGFENQVNPADTPPFTQGDPVGYTFPPQTTGTHWWRVAVRADDGTSWSDWSAPRSLTIDNVPPAPPAPLADYHISTEEQFLTITLENAAPAGDALVIANEAMPGSAKTHSIQLADLHAELGVTFSQWKRVSVDTDLPDGATSASVRAFDTNDVLVAGPETVAGPFAGEIILDLSGHVEPEIYIEVVMTPGSTPTVYSITVQGDDAYTVPTRIQFFEARALATEVELTWGVLTDGEPPRGFRVQRRSGEESFVDVAGLLPADARSLRDAALDPGETYTYRLSVVESDGAQTILADTEVELPALAMSLGQNVPNPFNPSTRIPFTVDRSAHVTLTIYTVAGEHVVTLVDESRPAGRGWADWNGTDAAGHTVASGVYYYQLRVDGRQRVRKMVMLR